MTYEIDDIILKDDIPLYNRCRSAFEDNEITKNTIQMMQMADEITVTCDHMRQYYESKTGNKRITVIPNYPAKMWMDNHFHPDKLLENYLKNKKKPRVGYIGSGTHIDVTGKNGLVDDFTHIVDSIIATRKEIQWVFIGSYPLQCKPFIDRGEMESISWFPLMDLWKAYTTTNLNAVIAPLQDNVFNRSKSNIKYLEAACCGVPGVFQDMVTYKEAPLRFTKGPDLIDQLKFLLKSEDNYVKYSLDARKYAETMWLDDHLDEYTELYNTGFDEPRSALSRLNPRATPIITI